MRLVFQAFLSQNKIKFSYSYDYLILNKFTFSQFKCIIDEKKRIKRQLADTKNIGSKNFEETERIKKRKRT